MEQQTGTVEEEKGQEIACRHENLFLTVKAVLSADKPRSDGSYWLTMSHDAKEASVKSAQCSDCGEQVGLPEGAAPDTDSAQEWLEAFYAPRKEVK